MAKAKKKALSKGAALKQTAAQKRAALIEQVAGRQRNAYDKRKGFIDWHDADQRILDDMRTEEAQKNQVSYPRKQRKP